MKGSKISQAKSTKQYSFEYKHDYSNEYFVKNSHKKPQLNFTVKIRRKI